jgi:Na+/H+-dicarboxylate symporter
MASLEIDGAVAASLRGTVAPSAPTTALPSFSAWLVGLVPANPIKSAVDGAMLPLIIFAVVFAAGLARTTQELRLAGTEFFRSVADAMLVVVGWVLALAPVGVFALAVTLAVRLGSGVVGAVGFYIALHGGLLTVEGVVYYIVARTAGGVPIARFARALLPAQVVAFSTRSSVAALPAMIDGAERVLAVSPQVASFALPLGVTLLRANSGVSWIVSAVFVAKLYGLHLAFSQTLLITALSVAMSFSVPGGPSGGLLIVAPAFMMVGLPVEGVGILIALDSIPDIFKTVINVTGQMTSTVVLARMERRSGSS